MRDVLEIGTGWGALAVRARAARRQGHDPHPFARATAGRQAACVARAGSADRVDVQLRDYRDAEGTYDAIVSVEMIEAVGERYWPTYFPTLERVLAPGGRIGIQAIVLEHARMVATRDQYTWIHKYIFPGGALPSVRAIERRSPRTPASASPSGSTSVPTTRRTLREWRARFDANADAVEALGFDRTFRRMWDFYLAYCEAGFATGYLDVVQLVLEAA